MTLQVRIDPDATSNSMLHLNRYWSILLNIPINYHPMNLLPSIASYSSNIANLFTKPLPHHRFDTLIGANPTALIAATLVATATVVTSPTVVDTVPATTASDSVPEPHQNPLPIVLDTGASFSLAPSTSDFLPSDYLSVAPAPYGLIRSPTSVIQSNSKPASTVDPYTLITGEDVSVAVDLSSSDLFALNSDSVETASSFAKVHFDIHAFGTATLTFIYSKSTSELLHIFVEPTQIDWLHWVPLPRLILPESYYHIFGLDYLQAFALLHLIPIWIYYLLHFPINLE